LQVNLGRTVGGAAFHHADLSLGLKTFGHEVLVADRLGPFLDQYTQGAVPQVQMWRGLTHYRLARILQTFRPDIIHTHQSLAARVANRLKRGIPVVSTIHAEFKKRSHMRSDGIIRVADHQSHGMSAYRGPAVTIWNWLRTGGPPVSIPAVRREFGIPESAIVFGSVGRVVRAKGTFDLIDAFATLQGEEIRLLIVGEGRDLPRAKARAAGDRRIRFAEHRPDAPALMAAMDVFVMPSHAETLPLVLIEAAAAGCAIVATETKGARELLCGQPARIVPIADVSALAAALHQVRTEAIAAAHKRCNFDLGEFDRDRQIAKTADFYRRVLTGAP
jgi:glycosyltransferase involved in cell wall biosynthesis